eukprot:m.301825 g.301825  ORF g.301825 m.301825 type:complete len:101 (+) comp16428_c0_seq59:1276-1578(+)
MDNLIKKFDEIEQKMYKLNVEENKLLKSLTEDEKEELFNTICKRHMMEQGYDEDEINRPDYLYHKINNEGVVYYFYDYTYFPTTWNLYEKIYDWLETKFC